MVYAGMRTKKRMATTGKKAVAGSVDGISPTKAKPKPVFEMVNSDDDSDSDGDSTSGDEEILKERRDKLKARLCEATEASQPARDNLTRLRKVVEVAQEEVFAARTIYNEENRKRKAEISSTSKEWHSIVNKLEKRTKKARILIAAGLKF